MTGDTPPAPTSRPRPTPRARFTLLGLMVGCFYAAFALAAVLRPSTLAAHFLQATMVCLLVAAAASALPARGPRRAFRIGFALLGFAYLGLAGLTNQGSPTLLATSRFLYRLRPGSLSLEDQPAFFASCAAIENAAYATAGGAVAAMLSLALGRGPGKEPTPR